MRVLQSLMTPGALVRTPSNRHGMVEAFDSRDNRSTVRFFDGLPPETFHLTVLRAGTDESELQACGKTSRDFPKLLPIGRPGRAGQARRLPTARMRLGDAAAPGEGS